MQVRELLHDDDAVSPVIGVILMVAITVILAAVIASFVLGLGGSTNKTPQAKFSWDYNSWEDDSYGNLTVTHDGGATIKASELVVRGQSINSSGKSLGTGSGDIFPAASVVESADTKWSTATSNGAATTSSEKGGDSAVVSGDYMKVWVNNDYDIRLVYESSEGDNSATLASDTGPKTS
ncbi:type IV pilin [Halorientalis brevis]|uniref:Type IV pilin n=1 Tax=Halorientalis brevis TaxID=1126241 RepID=A0ABD6CHT0_9EURY|nr:type IV pilin N-terminal domain-containing protein [Halorientalis brevis]